ncbi:hypothetical protein [Nocardia inohanensis]|uniref:hypothetical protein n=1 Tax=Nocardia inohanensis TaxID=209246 RepID=UPI00082F20A3|nr:hypothetical protein [Nocardia inohanensis]
MTGNHGIDWDGELQALMESSGIDPTTAQRPPWKTRARHKLARARAAGIAIAVIVPALWLTASSGAPAAATTPLRIWLTGWIGYAIWISLGRPDWTTTWHTTREFGIGTAQTVSRFVFARTRPLRARWRAHRLARRPVTVTV